MRIKKSEIKEVIRCLKVLNLCTNVPTSVYFLPFDENDAELDVKDNNDIILNEVLTPKSGYMTLTSPGLIVKDDENLYSEESYIYFGYATMDFPYQLNLSHMTLFSDEVAPADHNDEYDAAVKYLSSKEIYIIPKDKIIAVISTVE